jgi:hypothetical protein
MNQCKAARISPHFKATSKAEQYQQCTAMNNVLYYVQGHRSNMVKEKGQVQGADKNVHRASVIRENIDKASACFCMCRCSREPAHRGAHATGAKVSEGQQDPMKVRQTVAAVVPAHLSVAHATQQQPSPALLAKPACHNTQHRRVQNLGKDNHLRFTHCHTPITTFWPGYHPTKCPVVALPTLSAPPHTTNTTVPQQRNQGSL